MGTLRLPESDDPYLISGIIFALESEVGRELSEVLDKNFRSAGEIDWFESILRYRRSLAEYFGYKSPKDLRFILAESTHPESEILHFIPGVSSSWTNAANSLKVKLNQFHHGNISPDLNSLLIMATLFDSVAAPSGLETSKWARALISRTKSLLSGTYFSQVQTPSPVAPEGIKELEEKYKEVLDARAKRPPLGSPWFGDRPQRHLSLDRHTRDVYDRDGLSVKSEITQQGTEVIDKWLWYFPLGGDIFVADDGAVMGYIKGDKYMIGWLGPEPGEYSKVVRGFVLPYDYKFLGNDLREVSSDISLIDSSRDDCSELVRSLASKVQANTILSISDYGDIFIPREEGELVRLATAHRGIWFPGHLPGDSPGSI
jgi:hypothetical protein